MADGQVLKNKYKDEKRAGLLPGASYYPYSVTTDIIMHNKKINPSC
jgi:hypothetical protein